MRYEQYFMTASATKDVSKLPCMENLIPFRENNFDARKSHADIIASDNSSKASRALPRRRDICGSNFQEIALINPFNTTQYVKSDGFQVLLDRHVMYAIGTASDFELMK